MIQGSRPIPILHLINGEFFAGAERVQVIIGKNLSRDKYSLSYVALLNGLFIEQALKMDLDLTVIPMKNKLDISVVPKIIKFVRQRNIRLIHTHTVRTNLIGRIVGRWLNLPVITHIHSPNWRESTNRISNIINDWLDMQMAGYTNHFIAVNTALQNHYLRRGIPQEKISTIYNAIEIESYMDFPIKDISGRDNFVFGFIALFRPRKGTEVFLHAIKRFYSLNGFRDQVKFLMIGGFESGPYEQKIRDLASTLQIADKIEFCGFRSQMEEVIQNIDVLVLPSLFGEGTPMVVIEAMAAGKPVIATRIEGVEEMIEDGVDGLLVPPGDDKSLAEAFITISQDKQRAQHMGQCGRIKAAQHYNAKTMISRLEKIYSIYTEKFSSSQ
jgi:glycosyltransferase involved in cell wall biosynthesis